ncbi:MAG: hypothetical protein ACUVXD_06800 [Thermodesulfobacteriota bacterium]
MEVSLHVNGRAVEINPFLQTYLANICRAILNSLKGTEGARRALFRIRGKELELVVEDKPVDLRMRTAFAMVLVRDTLLGVLAHFHGIRGWKEIQVDLTL